MDREARYYRGYRRALIKYLIYMVAVHLLLSLLIYMAYATSYWLAVPVVLIGLISELVIFALHRGQFFAMFVNTMAAVTILIIGFKSALISWDLGLIPSAPAAMVFLIAYLSLNTLVGLTAGIMRNELDQRL